MVVYHSDRPQVAECLFRLDEIRLRRIGVVLKGRGARHRQLGYPESVWSLRRVVHDSLYPDAMSGLSGDMPALSISWRINETPR